MSLKLAHALTALALFLSVAVPIQAGSIDADDCSKTPGAAELMSPSGDIGLYPYPNFVWQEEPCSTWYYLWIGGPTGNIVKKWYRATDICSDGSCYAVSVVTLREYGVYRWWVQARNSYGYGPWSDLMEFTVASTIRLEITSPVDGESISKPFVMAQGRMINLAGNETGIIVNGVSALLHGDRFVANHVSLVEGENTITGTATDTEGNIREESTKVSAETTLPYILLSADEYSGMAPLVVTLKVDSEGLTISQVKETDGWAFQYTTRDGEYYFVQKYGSTTMECGNVYEYAETPIHPVNWVGLRVGTNVEATKGLGRLEVEREWFWDLWNSVMTHDPKGYNDPLRIAPENEEFILLYAFLQTGVVYISHTDTGYAHPWGSNCEIAPYEWPSAPVTREKIEDVFLIMTPFYMLRNGYKFIGNPDYYNANNP